MSTEDAFKALCEGVLFEGTTKRCKLESQANLAASGVGEVENQKRPKKKRKKKRACQASSLIYAK